MKTDKSRFVLVKDLIPDIKVDLKYATADNFTGKKIYMFQDAYLRQGTAEKLRLVQQILKEKGFALKIWDAFRPAAAQFALWEAVPDPMFVADPTQSYSNHSRGNTVDATLIYLNGAEAEMPTGFDDFTKRANRSYSGLPPTVRENALLLEKAMKAGGFLTDHWPEWWHYTDSERYSVETEFMPGPC